MSNDSWKKKKKEEKAFLIFFFSKKDIFSDHELINIKITERINAMSNAKYLMATFQYRCFIED